MGLLLLREAFEAITEMSADPIFSAGSKRADILFDLNQALAVAQRRAKDLQAQASRLMAGIPSSIREYLANGNSRDEILAELEHVRTQIQDRQEISIALEERTRILADGVHADVYRILFNDADTILSTSRRLHEYAQAGVASDSQLLDFLTAVLADTDPNASSGPSFDNADDLIAFLNR